MREDNGNEMLWFLVGVTIGAAVAITFAPASGADTRRMLAQKADRARGFLSESRRDYFERGRHLYEQGRMLADEAAEMFNEGRRLVESTDV